jgi:hypothetical protein
MAERIEKDRKKKRMSVVPLERALRFLSPHEVTLIDEMLDSVSPFGEVTLRVQGGKLCFAARSKSYDALKLQRPRANRE